MSEFKVGEKVIRVNSNPYSGRGYSKECQRGFVGVVDKVSDSGSWLGFEGYRYGWDANNYELLEEREVKKYKLKTELSLGQMKDLESRIAPESSLYDLWDEVDDLIKNSRKVVTIGDKEYYEDELQAALANIKPINQ